MLQTAPAQRLTAWVGARLAAGLCSPRCHAAALIVCCPTLAAWWVVCLAEPPPVPEHKFWEGDAGQSPDRQDLQDVVPNPAPDKDTSIQT